MPSPASMELERVAVKGYQLRLGLFAAVVILVFVNTVGFWGDEVARLSEIVLQSIIGAGGVVCGLVVASRVSGLGGGGACW